MLQTSSEYLLRKAKSKKHNKQIKTLEFSISKKGSEQQAATLLGWIKRRVSHQKVAGTMPVIDVTLLFWEKHYTNFQILCVG